jgi:hypothetical protein
VNGPNLTSMLKAALRRDGHSGLADDILAVVLEEVDTRPETDLIIRAHFTIHRVSDGFADTPTALAIVNAANEVARRMGIASLSTFEMHDQYLGSALYN